MTEEEWLACANPMRMVAFLNKFTTKTLNYELSDRKLRLFAVACCRSAIELASRPVSDSLESDLWKDVQAAERIAEGLVPQPTNDLTHLYGFYSLFHGSARKAEWACHSALSPSALSAAAGVIDTLDDTVWADDATNCGAVYLREIFGNPFRTVTVDPSWLTSTVVALASQMYESRDFCAMPILADALQDAGCDCERILNHLRDPNATHVRGCWALDLVLGKA
jgi:hypothetical protein